MERDIGSFPRWLWNTRKHSSVLPGLQDSCFYLSSLQSGLSHLCYVTSFTSSLQGPLFLLFTEGTTNKPLSKSGLFMKENKWGISGFLKRLSSAPPDSLQKGGKSISEMTGGSVKRILCLLFVYFPMNSSNSTGTTRMEKGRKKLYIAKNMQTDKHLPVCGVCPSWLHVVMPRDCLELDLFIIKEITSVFFLKSKQKSNQTNKTTKPKKHIEIPNCDK